MPPPCTRSPTWRVHGGRHAVCNTWRDMWRHPHAGGHPNGTTCPATPLMRAWRNAMRPSLLPRGGPPLVGIIVALPATSITSQPHFFLFTIFSLSPFLIPLVIPSLAILDRLCCLSCTPLITLCFSFSVYCTFTSFSNLESLSGSIV